MARKNCLYIVFILALLMTGVSSCSETEDPAINPSLSKSSVTVKAGQTETVTISGGVAPYIPSINSSSIARASISGSTLTIEGIAPGSATVTVSGDDSGRTSLSVTVTN